MSFHTEGSLPAGIAHRWASSHPDVPFNNVMVLLAWEETGVHRGKGSLLNVTFLSL